MLNKCILLHNYRKENTEKDTKQHTNHGDLDYTGKNIVWRGSESHPEARLIDLESVNTTETLCAWHLVGLPVKPGVCPLIGKDSLCNELIGIENNMKLWDTEYVLNAGKIAGQLSEFDSVTASTVVLGRNIKGNIILSRKLLPGCSLFYLSQLFSTPHGM